MIQKETIENSESKTNSASKLPEKEFFDREPSANEHQNNLSNTRNRKRTFGVILVCVAAALMFILVAKGCHTGHSRKTPLQEDEKREMVTQSSMERAIESSRPKEEIVPQQSTRQTQSKRKERSLKSDIAVYVYENKLIEKNVPVSSGSKKIPIGLPSGTKVPALLEDRVFSFNIAAPVLAIVSQDFKKNGMTVIPKGSKFLGESSVLKSLDRINVSFDLLIFPDGTEKRIRAMALADDGASGIRGRVDKHRDLKILKVIGETLLSGASLFVGGVNRNAYSLEDQLRSNFAQNMTNQAGQDLRTIRTDESISVEASTPVQVMFLESI